MTNHNFKIYLRINKQAEFKINKVPKIIVKLCNTFSGHLLVISFIPQLIVLKFRAVHLFCIKTTKIRRIAIRSSIKVKKFIMLFIFLFIKYKCVYNIQN